MSINNTNNTNNTKSGILELARPTIELFGEEIENRDGLRVAAALEAFANGFDEDDHGSEAPYMLRDYVGAQIGFERADADADEYMYGIPIHKAFLELRRVYGENWARRAYADYLAHFGGVPCQAPVAVANLKFDQIEVRYKAFLKA